MKKEEPLVNKGRIVAEIGIMTALALVLEFVTTFIPGMPQGGKFISLGMIHLLLIAISRGWKAGITAGVVFGFFIFIQERVFIHIFQVILDYPMAFGVVGLAGIIPESYKDWKIYLSIFIGLFLRFCCHVLSGVVFFSSFAPSGVSPWSYSIIYNATYMIPTLIVCLRLLPPLIRRFKEQKRL